MDKKEIFLIDGSAYLYRAFHAIKSLTTSQGHPTNATFGFSRILLKLVKDKAPAYAAVFFDAKGDTFRNELYSEYKANRPMMDEALATQIPDIKNIVKSLNFKVIEKEGYEADDLIGTYARLARENNFRVVVVTGDKDFVQIVSEDCIIWDPMKDRTTDPETVKKEYGILPGQFVDMLGLMGDKSDNIPGVPGVGPKTAEKLISEFGSMDTLFDNIERLSNKGKLYQNLKENKAEAYLSRDLATIEQRVAVEEDLEAFCLSVPDREKVAALFRKYEFRTLAKEFSSQPDLSAKDYRLITETGEIEALVSDLEKRDIFAVDTETTAKNPIRADLVGISFSFKTDQAFYIPVGHRKTETAQPDKDTVLEMLKPLLENREIKKVGQNIKYDYIVFYRNGIDMQGIGFDTMIGSYLDNPSIRGHSLDQIAMNLFGYKTISYEELVGKGKNQVGFHELDASLAVNYACEDADLTFRAYSVLEDKLAASGLSELMETIEIPLLPVLAAMEMAGIKVDRQKLADLSQDFSDRLLVIEKEIYDLAGREFNINSSQQLGEILFDELKLPVVKKTKKTKGYSTDVDVLQRLSREHELPENILKYRSIVKLKSTYADALMELINPVTGRIHTSFNQTVTATGRLSSSTPNLQNIPVRTEEGRKIRAAFVPEAGHVFVSADYSQIELRILAHCAEDEILIDAFSKGEDIHERTAVEVFGTVPEQVTEELRRQAKAINFGIVYGMSAFRLSNDLGISRKMAQNCIDSYFKRYAGVKAFIDKTIETARETGEVKTLFGRKRNVAEINAANTNTRRFAERIAINAPIQGSAADLMKLAMIKMYKTLKEHRLKAEMLLSVHDEIIFEVPEEEIGPVIELAKRVMENIMVLKVPLQVNIGTGMNWAQAH